MDGLSTNGAGTTGQPHAKKKKKNKNKNLDTDLKPFTKINSELIIDLNIECWGACVGSVG